jgi:succinate dehydrogenase hydrophobic anchor subunit
MERQLDDKKGAFRWVAQAGLGVLLIALLSIHLAVNHLIAPQGLLSQADVVRYFKVPGIAVMEALFLIAVTTHCLLGLHSILLDLDLTAPLKTLFTWILVLLGVSGIMYGLWLTWTIASIP